jgi:hypothetical protein
MRFRFILLFLAVALSCSAKQSVSQQTDNKHTFVVDENLPAPKKDFGIQSGDLIAQYWASKNNVNKPIAYSFENDNLCYLGQDIFFKFMVEAYADHRPIVLSPDIIWNVIAQGFSQHVNNNPEALRDRIVYHEKGKIELSVITKEELHSPNVKWDKLLNTFDNMIAESTKDNLADVMRADFSTTDKTARIVSQMTLMSSVKAFFDYSVIYFSCGIPNITIEGTTDDWEKVLNKTQQLRKYNLDWWVGDLVPILNEFINASKGNVNKVFWRNIVKKDRPEKFVGGGCSWDRPTELDGWFLKFMPYDKKGKRTPQKVTYNYKDMPSQVINVDFMYKNLDTGTTTPMEMLCGLVGIEVDSITNAMRPKLGWMVCEKNKQLEIESLTENPVILTEIPDILQNIEYEPSICLVLKNNDIKLPEWFGNLKVDRIRLQTKKNDKFKKELEKMFPDRKVVSKGVGYNTIKECDTEYIVQTKKSFEPENHLYTMNQIRNSQEYEFASFPGKNDYEEEKKFIKENRRIPESENIDFDDRKMVRVMFTVDIDGSISDFEITEVVNSATREMQEEALRLAKMLPKHVPAMVSNVENEPLHKVRSKDNIIISF